MKKLILVLFLVVSSISMQAQQPKSKPVAPKKPVAKKQEAPREKWDMKTYYLVFLKKGPNRSQDSATAAKIQEGHMTHLEKMYKEGKMDLAGPMMNDGDLRGICVYNVASEEEVKKLTAMDPAVQSGRLIVEIHPWYAARGSVLR
jgi:uncharacterized protein